MVLQMGGAYGRMTTQREYNYTANALFADAKDGEE